MKKIYFIFALVLLVCIVKCNPVASILLIGIAFFIASVYVAYKFDNNNK